MVPARCNTVRLLTLDTKDVGIRKIVLRHWAWKPSSLLKSFVVSHADAVPYMTLLKMHALKISIFLNRWIAVCLQAAYNPLKAADADPILRAIS